MKNAAQLLDTLEHLYEDAYLKRDEEYNQYDEEGLMTPDSAYFWDKYTEEQKWIEKIIQFLKLCVSTK